MKKKIIVAGSELPEGAKVSIAGKMFIFQYCERSRLLFISGNMKMNYPASSRFVKLAKSYVFQDFGVEKDNEQSLT